MQHQLIQLQQELKKAKEEKCQALQELEEMRWRMLSDKNGHANSVRSKARMEMLEAELEKARESERKLLESLTSQTKQLEQTKILLEEAKLEIRSLNESKRILEGSASRGPKALGKSMTLDVVRGHEEIGMLRTELRLALEAEEKSKKAMDDLAMVLKEVSTESNKAWEKLSKAQSELHSTRAENEHLKTMLRCTEEKLRVKLEESMRLKLEAEETFAAWSEKENGFIKCMKMSEEEITSLKRENRRLVDSQRAAREEISKLRDILKQAINEANVVKEALEIARTENSQLKDTLSEKDKALQCMKQEFECLKVSEAAAVDSVRELQRLLVAASMDLSRNTNASTPKALADGVRTCKPMAKFPSDRWKGEELKSQANRRRSLGDSEKFEVSIFDMIESPDQKKDHTVALIDKCYEKSVNFDDSDHLNGRHLEGSEFGWESPMRQRKKRQILRKFGDLLRRRSFNK